jgi:hypothetical protein
MRGQTLNASKIFIPKKNPGRKRLNDLFIIPQTHDSWAFSALRRFEFLQASCLDQLNLLASVRRCNIDFAFSLQ